MLIHDPLSLTPSVFGNLGLSQIVPDCSDNTLLAKTAFCCYIQAGNIQHINGLHNETGMNINETTKFFEKLWFEKKGLIASIVVVTSGLFPLLLLKISLLWDIGCTLLIDIAIALLWLWSRKPPRTDTNKIGFLICISCSDDNECQKLQEDFIQPLRELLKSGRAGSVIQILEIPQHIATTIKDVEQATALRIKCRAHFIIHGRAKIREINGQEMHVLDLEGGVSHSPVMTNFSQSFAKEFTELLPRKLQLSKENDLFAFQFTSEWTDVVSRYIIGIASAISGDLDYAEHLFLDAKDRLQNKDAKFHIYTKLKERVPRRLFEISLLRIRSAYLKWVESKDVNYLHEVEHYIQHLAPEYSNDKEVLNFKAIIAFVSKKDVEEAIRLIRKTNDRSQSHWHLNLAFLLAYNGDLKNAIRHYRIASRLPDIPPVVLSQIEDFIVWTIKNEPEKCQLYYILGFFNWKIKGDLIRATKDFSAFLKQAPTSEMDKEKELAQQWIHEIQKQLNSK